MIPLPAKCFLTNSIDGKEYLQEWASSCSADLALRVQGLIAKPGGKLRKKPPDNCL